jgi:hypothetical protein
LANALKVKHGNKARGQAEPGLNRIMDFQLAALGRRKDDDRKLAHAAVAKAEYVKQ